MAETESAARDWTPIGVRLLDADPDLGAGLSEDDRAHVMRQLVVPTVVVEPGAWDPQRLSDAGGVEGDARGFLVLDGMVVIEVALGGRTCTRLILPQDLLLLDGLERDLLPLRWGWSALDRVTLAVLDRRLELVAQRWPALMSQILKRSALLVRQSLLQQAISQLPRVEDRLLALLWAVGERQGIVRGRQIYVRLPVTHEVLAHLVGAQRPTVSLGLKKLADGGLAIAEHDGWLIDRDSLSVFGSGPPPA